MLLLIIVMHDDPGVRTVRWIRARPDPLARHNNAAARAIAAGLHPWQSSIAALYVLCLLFVMPTCAVARVRASAGWPEGAANADACET